MNDNEEWNPGFWKINKDGREVWIDYEKKWYCNENKIIHGNEKEYLNCQYCTKKLLEVKKNEK